MPKTKERIESDGKQKQLEGVAVSRTRLIILMAVFTFYPIINTIGISFLKKSTICSAPVRALPSTTILRFSDQAPEGSRRDEVLYHGLHRCRFAQYASHYLHDTVPISIFIALAIAIALNSITFMKKIFQTIFFMPYVTNAIAIGMVFSVIFDNNGIFNYIFHTNIAWLYSGSSGI